VVDLHDQVIEALRAALAAMDNQPAAGLSPAAARVARGIVAEIRTELARAERAVELIRAIVGPAKRDKSAGPGNQTDAG
jgi:hypothetical protein